MYSPLTAKHLVYSRCGTPAFLITYGSPAWLSHQIVKNHFQPSNTEFGWNSPRSFVLLEIEPKFILISEDSKQGPPLELPLYTYTLEAGPFPRTSRALIFYPRNSVVSGFIHFPCTCMSLPENHSHSRFSPFLIHHTSVCLRVLVSRSFIDLTIVILSHFLFDGFAIVDKFCPRRTCT